MSLNQIEQTLQAMLEAERAAQKQQRWQLSRLFRRRTVAFPKGATGIAVADSATEQKQRWQLSRLFRGQAAAVQKSLARSGRRSDFIIAGLGVALGLVCALFPWYIFFNQEKFGIQALQFDSNGQGSKSRPLALSARFLHPGEIVAEEGRLGEKLDPFTTSTLPDTKDKKASVADQPFPAEDIPYRLVHVVNGRALIEDDSGLWVVQPGALLPDSSRVAGIEQRGGKWILLTSKDKTVNLTQ